VHLTTLVPMLPPAPTAPGLPATALPAGEPPRRRRWILLGVAVLLLVSAIVGAALIQVPYVALRPGSVRPVTEKVEVAGAPTYPPSQSISYTTVSVGSTTMLEALAGWLDDDVDVLPEERVRGDRTEDENRRYNAQLMDTSKLVAVAVALDRLGEDVEITTTGTIVRDMAPGSPSTDVLQIDDVIVAVDGEPVDEPNEIGDLLQPGGPGAAHTLTVERPAGTDTLVDVEVTTVAADDDPERAIIGIAPEDRITDFDFPIDVTIDSGTVGGPSAGLAFTLAVIDVLTPGELTGGHRVAVTGTMDLDGRVGPVGGGAQKAIAVRDAGYEVFLVPSDELEEVQEAVGDQVEVVAVDTLEEALEALDSMGGNAGARLAAGPATTDG
jgi:PDZ domain-containing protein